MDGDKTWQETKDACADAGSAKIAVPSSSDENVFLHDLALQYGGNMWIGVRENVSALQSLSFTATPLKVSRLLRVSLYPTPFIMRKAN